MRPLLMLPEICTFLGGLIALMAGSFLARERQWITRVLTAIALALAIISALWGIPQPTSAAFEGSFVVDTSTTVARVLVALGTLLILGLASDEMASAPRESETYALMLFASTGVLVLAGAQDMLVLAAGFLLASIPLYGLIGMSRSAPSAEAAMKTYLLGALFGIVLLGGVTVLYGVSGATRYADLAQRLPDAPSAAVAAGTLAIITALMFKAGGVPAHYWVPDAAQGASVTAATFVTTVPKIGALIAAYRFVMVLPDSLAWPLFVAVLAAVSMTLGNLAAYRQEDPRRLLGWSTVSQVGYLLVPVAMASRSEMAAPALLIYLCAYTVTNIAAFAVTAALPQYRSIENYRGLARLHPWLAVSLAVALLGLLGTPPTSVFVGKLTVVLTAWDSSAVWLAIVVLINTLLSLSYYLRWFAQPFRALPEDDREVTVATQVWASATAVCASTMSVAVGLAAGVLLSVLSQS